MVKASRWRTSTPVSIISIQISVDQVLPADYSSISDTSAVPNADFPTAKIPGGTDLAGDAYNADTNPFPAPDNNPLDCNGHGTGTASLIGGLGVTNAGFTYTRHL